VFHEEVVYLEPMQNLLDTCMVCLYLYLTCPGDNTRIW